MTPTDLQYVQVRIGNSFLKAFYPADYRAMKQTSGELIKLENDEYRRLRTTEQLTSKISVKMSRTIGLLEKEINQLLAALDSVQNAVYIGGSELFEADSMEEAMQRATGGFDLFRTWREMQRIRRILRRRQEKLQKKKDREKKKADEKAKEKAAADEAEKAKQAEAEKLKNNEDGKVKPNEKPGGTVEETKPIPKNRSLVDLADDFAKNPTAEAEAALKAGLKNATDPKLVLTALKNAKNAYVAFDIAATRILTKILGSRLVRYGGIALIVGIEAWAGWEEYVIVQEAYEKGYISAIMKSTLVRNIIATHAVVAVASGIFATIGASIGATIGAIGLGIGAIFGGVLGAVVGGTMGALAAEYLVQILLENKTFSDYFDDAIDAVSEAFGYDYKSDEAEVTVAPASPAVPSLTSPAMADTGEAPPPVTTQAAAPPVDTPTNQQQPESNRLPDAVPAPVTYETPSLTPETTTAASSDTPNLSPDVVRDQISNQIKAPELMRSQPGSDSTVAYNNPPQTDLSSNDIPAGTGNVKVIEAYGVHRPGRPIARIREIAVRAAERVGMSQITFTSGVGDWISDKRKNAGQKTTRHALGDALDVTGFASSSQAVSFMRAARSLGAGGIGWYGDGSVHIDLGRQREWDRAKGVPGLAEGGKIHPQNGGTLALVAEAGEPEYIVPQSKVENFAHEMLASRPTTRNKTKKHTHVLVVNTIT